MRIELILTETAGESVGNGQCEHPPCGVLLQESDRCRIPADLAAEAVSQKLLEASLFLFYCHKAEMHGSSYAIISSFGGNTGLSH